MPAEKQLTPLQERKRLLLLQANLHRTLLRAECAGALARLSWLNKTRRVAQSAGPWVAVGAAAVGFLAAWRGRKLGIWIPSVLEVWRGVQKLKYR